MKELLLIIAVVKPIIIQRTPPLVMVTKFKDHAGALGRGTDAVIMNGMKLKSIE